MLQIQQKVHRKKYDYSFINWNQFIILPSPNRSGSHDSENFTRERKTQIPDRGSIFIEDLAPVFPGETFRALKDKEEKDWDGYHIRHTV